MHSGVTGGHSGVTGGHSGVTSLHSGVTGGRSGVTGGHSAVTGASARSQVPSHNASTANRNTSSPANSKHAADKLQQSEKQAGIVNVNFILYLTGLDRAPVLLLAEAFALFWGIAGLLSNQYLLRSAEPTPREILRSLLVAGIAGIIGARVTAEIIKRYLPHDESLDQSRSSLFGLVGSVAFSATESTGRIHIYDQYGSLHDESCRIRAGQAAIERGAHAIVLDIDSDGKLIVEEVTG